MTPFGASMNHAEKWNWESSSSNVSERGCAVERGKGAQAARDEDVPAPVLTLALLMRFVSRQDESYAAKLLAASGEEPSPAAPAAPLVQPLVEPLSERELEVLRLLAQGLTNREIAEQLTVTLGTAKTHVNHIYGKDELGGTSWMYLSPIPFEELGFPTLKEQTVTGLSETVAASGTPAVALGVALFLSSLYYRSKSKAGTHANAAVHTGE